MSSSSSVAAPVANQDIILYIQEGLDGLHAIRNTKRRHHEYLTTLGPNMLQDFQTAVALAERLGDPKFPSQRVRKALVNIEHTVADPVVATRSIDAFTAACDEFMAAFVEMRTAAPHHAAESDDGETLNTSDDDWHSSEYSSDNDDDDDDDADMDKDAFIAADDEVAADVEALKMCIACEDEHISAAIHGIYHGTCNISSTGRPLIDDQGRPAKRVCSACTCDGIPAAAAAVV